jgi:hypothetical protein
MQKDDQKLPRKIREHQGSGSLPNSRQYLINNSSKLQFHPRALSAAIKIHGFTDPANSAPLVEPGEPDGAVEDG